MKHTGSLRDKMMRLLYIPIYNIPRWHHLTYLLFRSKIYIVYLLTIQVFDTGSLTEPESTYFVSPVM